MTRLILANRDGYCVTQEGLDTFWPEDDRPVDMTSAAFKLFSGGKGQALDTCPEDFQTYEEQVAPHDLFRFVFDGPAIDPGLHQVPAGASLPYLVAGVLAMWAMKWRWHGPR